MSHLPLPQLFPPPQGREVSAEQVAHSLSFTVNELQRWLSRSMPTVLDDNFHPKTERQEVTTDFIIEPQCFNIELVATGAVTSDAVNAIKDGEHGQVLLIENISAFVITILNGATTRLAGGLDFAMNSHSTLLVKWNGEDWIEVSRSQN